MFLHLQNTKRVRLVMQKKLDWNDANFVVEILKIDKPKPVFIFVKKEGIVERH